nr:pentatricopeptide repeat-containing protein DOT4, chloroplastic [Tanacetum cinerariifolium]
MMGNVKLGRSIHGYAVKGGFGKEMKFGNTLYDIYSKYGDMDAAMQVFENMDERSVVSWTWMIARYARKGQSDEAIGLFLDMKKERVKPDIFTGPANKGYAVGALGHKLIEKRTHHIGLYPIVITTVSVKLYNSIIWSITFSSLIINDEKIFVLRKLKTDDSAMEYPVLRYRLELEISDDTAEAVVVMFDVTTTSLLKCSASAMVASQAQNCYKRCSGGGSNSGMVAAKADSKAPELKRLNKSPLLSTPLKPREEKKHMRDELEDSDVKRSFVADCQPKRDEKKKGYVRGLGVSSLSLAGRGQQ